MKGFIKTTGKFYKSLSSHLSYKKPHQRKTIGIACIASVLDIIYQKVFSTIEKEFDILIPQSSSWFLTFLSYCQGYPSSIECCPFQYQHLQTTILPGIGVIDSSYSLLCVYISVYHGRDTWGDRFRSVMWYSRKESS